MKITKENIKETLRSIMQEESEYQVFFRKALEKAGKSITDMSDEEKKAFFNKIDSAWDGKGEKNEELTGNQHKLDIDGDGEIEASDLAALRASKKKEESVNESKKMFSVHPHSVGGKKFDITIYDGRKNKDGSPFIGVVTANHALELKDKIQAYKSNGYTEVDNVGKKLGVKHKNERFGRGIQDPAFGDVYQDDIKTISEKVSPKDLEAIKGAVESASSFMGVGSELKKLGMKYIFATSPIPIYVVQDKSGNRVGIVNKKYATKPDFVIGDTAIGVMESKVNEYSVNKKFGSKYDIGAGQFPTGTVFWNRAEDEDGDYKKLAHVADNGKITFYDKALPSNVKKHIEDYAKTQTESVNELKDGETVVLKRPVNYKLGVIPAGKSVKVVMISGIPHIEHPKNPALLVQVRDLAKSIDEQSVNEEEIRWNAVENAIINFLKVNTKILDKRVQAKDTDGVKGGLKSIISGLTNAQRSLKLESVNEASYVSGYTVKAKTPYEFVNGAYAVLSAYLRDEELGPKGKKELQNILKSLEYMRKYFFFKLNESVNEIIKTYKPGDGEEVAKIYSGHLKGDARYSHALTVVDVLHANNLVTKSVAQKMEQELANSLARLRKAKSESVNEGRAFVNAAKKAKAEGKTEFEFNGKKYPVTVK